MLTEIAPIATDLTVLDPCQPTVLAEHRGASAKSFDLLHPSELVGTQLGNYTLVRWLAAGGMGLVYEAVHCHLGRRVAIKLLRERFLDSPELVRRFLGEAVVAANIGHPGVVSVHDYGQTQNGAAYLVMEFLDGETLAQRCRRSPLPISQVLRVGAEVAAAMAAVHEFGIVHRDLKPDNVILARDPSGASPFVVKVLDFGIARVPRSLGSEATDEGRMIGTPTYMSPEQIAGRDDLDHRSDVYALGCLLYYLLAGHPPFSGNVPAVLEAHRLRAPRPLRETNPHVPAALEELVAAMLAKRPEERPRDMRQVEATLRDIAQRIEAFAVVPRRDQPADALRRTARIRRQDRKRRGGSQHRPDRARAAGFALFLAVLLAGLGAAWAFPVLAAAS